MSIARPARTCIAGLLLGLALGALLAPSALAQNSAEEAPAASAEFRKLLRTYLEIQGSALSYGDNVAYQTANDTLMQFAANGMQVTEQMQQVVLDEAQAKFGARFRDLDFLTDLFAPIYAKHFSEEDMKALVEFWSSPVGRKTLETSIPMTQESMAATQQVIFELAPDFHLGVDARLRELGYEPVAPPGAGAPVAPAAP